MIPTREVIVFPAVEPLLIGYLTDAFENRGETALVSDTVPSPDRPGRMVKVTAAGPSQRANLVTSIRSVIVECWDTDRDDAANLAELAYAVACSAVGAIGSAFVRHVETVGEPVYFPDPRTDLPRYQFTVSLALAPTN